MFVSRCCGVFAVFLELVDRFVSCVAICQRATTVPVGLFYRGLTKEFGQATSCGAAMFGVKFDFAFGVVKMTRGCDRGVCQVARVGCRRVVTMRDRNPVEEIPRSPNVVLRRPVRVPMPLCPSTVCAQTRTSPPPEFSTPACVHVATVRV